MSFTFSPQVPELFGPIRTVAEGRGESVLIGTTKNFVLKGSLDGEFIPITQVVAQFGSLFLNLYYPVNSVYFSDD